MGKRGTSLLPSCFQLIERLIVRLVPCLSFPPTRHRPTRDQVGRRGKATARRLGNQKDCRDQRHNHQGHGARGATPGRGPPAGDAKARRSPPWSDRAARSGARKGARGWMVVVVASITIMIMTKHSPLLHPLRRRCDNFASALSAIETRPLSASDSSVLPRRAKRWNGPSTLRKCSACEPKRTLKVGWKRWSDASGKRSRTGTISSAARREWGWSRSGDVFCCVVLAKVQKKALSP